MLRLTTDRLAPGMTLARDVYNENGNLLLNASATLDRHRIFRLNTAGIGSVFVRKPYSAIEPEEIIHQRTRTEALQFIHRNAGSFFQNRNIEISGLKEVIRNIVEEAVDNRHVLVHLSSLRLHDDYTFGHSLNVCLLSVLVGIKLHLPARQLTDLAMGALLHDLGKMLIPPEILKKPGALTDVEWQTIRRHGEEAFNILRCQWALPIAAAHIACQHHENFDGSGYPRGLSGEEIHLYARIVAVADNFDAVTSDRPYRDAYLPHEAYEVILGSRGTKLDPRIVDLFLENVAIYPEGATVALDSGEIGIVICAPVKLSTRPTVKIIGNRDGTPYTGTERLIDLTRELTKFIVKVFRPGEADVCGGWIGCKA